ncbi:hypothetical protein B0T24DRAFT_221134 [Lasiosphaeria ovina]|uniref:Rhodopsin domain-containing protein n=1 Tax=Lasiosphaeria ovina TaxID=92902 RepID=A0AAE0NAV3_9PEZI|nr:hypothetical protein B0T24DRAFT_221134 [Lasiosphaeria ovina]
MGFGGDAPWALGVMWFLTALVFVFLLLRLYTRIVCLAAYGLDDHVYLVAFVFLLIYNIFIHVAGTYGFGQTLAEIGDMERAVKATLYECIGQGFAIVGMSIAKASLGFFLLRLVTIQWHRIAIWCMMTLVALASIAQVLCFWLSCVPLDYVYDRRIPGGRCPIDTRPTSYILCVSTILADFFYATFPWVIVWPLHMGKREKLTIAGSMSLGLIAAAAGIKRTTEVEGLYSPDYLKTSVGLIVWSAVEMAVTLICIGIPVCRPLYKRMFKRLRNGEGSSGGYHKQSGSNNNNNPHQNDSSYVLRTIGGGAVGADGKPLPLKKAASASGTVNTATDNDGGKRNSDDISFTDVKIGVNGPFTRTTVGRGRRSSVADNTSDEEILDEYRQSQRQQQRRPSDLEDGEGRTKPPHGITVTESYRVERT